MIKKFQHKLLLAFGLLIAVIIALVFQTVNTTIDSVSQVRIENDLKTAQRVFEEFALSKRKTRSEAAAALIKSHPVLRAILGSHSTGSEDLFGESTASAPQQNDDLSNRIFSTVESLDLYQNSEIFAITDEKANLLFTKVDPKISKTNLGDLEIVKAALAGNEVATRWGSEEELYRKLGLVPKTAEPFLYDVFFKPIVFGDEVKGLMVIGFPITSADLLELEQVTRAKISFVVDGRTYGNAVGVPENAVSNLKSNDSALMEIKRNDEIYLSLISKFKESIGEGKAASVIFRSKSEELSFYTQLKQSLNLLGIAALILGLILAIFISGGVTSSIRILMTGVEEISKGNLDHRVEVKGVDEFYQLAEEFNKMTKGLKEKEHIKKTFKRYVSPRIVNSLLEDQNKLKLGGDKREIVIYFADIAGFTTLSEKLSAEETISFLNAYLSGVASLIESEDGIIDKYIGDAVMAYWLPAEHGENVEEKVCGLALKHSEFVDSLRKEFKFTAENVNFDVRIGIHSGEAIIGNIGSSERMDFTIIGDNVNLASRLESLNKQYGSKIIVSDEVAKKARARYVLRELDIVRVVGKIRPVIIHDLLRARTSQTAQLDEDGRKFHTALELYRKGEFTEALSLFLHLDTDPVARKFSARCAELAAHPPAQWDGSYQALLK